MSAISLFNPRTNRFARLLRQLLACLASCTILCLPGGAGGEPLCPDSSNGDLVIHNNCTYTISGFESYANVVVKAGGTLELAAGGVLIVTTSVSVHAHGEFKFAATAGSAGVLRAAGFFSVVTLDGPFTVTGSAGARFDRVLFSSFHLLSGGLITSDSGPVAILAPMDVEGVVRATGTSTSYLITFSAAPASGSTGRFESADNDNARMKFDAGVTWATMVTGPYFDIRQGGMTFNQSVGDEAGLRMLDGFMTVAAGKTFTANEAFVAP